MTEEEQQVLNEFLLTGVGIEFAPRNLHALYVKQQLDEALRNLILSPNDDKLASAYMQLREKWMELAGKRDQPPEEARIILAKAGWRR